MAKCPICNERSPSRLCPALGKRICSICCGEHRRKSIACPSSCEFLLTAERKLWDRRGQELSKEWEKLLVYLREKGKGHLVPMLQVLRESLAQGIHKLDVTDEDVIAALDYCAQQLSPIELLERPPNILGRALEETLVPLVQSGKLDRELTREALETLAARLEEGARNIGAKGENRRYVPHLTLGRIRSAPRDFQERFDSLQKPVLGTFQAEGLTLFMSELTPQGSLYTVLDRVKFAG